MSCEDYLVVERFVEGIGRKKESRNLTIYGYVFHNKYIYLNANLGCEMSLLASLSSVSSIAGNLCTLFFNIVCRDFKYMYMYYGQSRMVQLKCCDYMTVFFLT